MDGGCLKELAKLGLIPMNQLERFCIATSIAPGNVAIQTEAVNSWLREGFSVVSINCRQEIEVLSDIYPQVRFVESIRDARDKFSKPYIYFDEFLDFFKSSEYRRFGLINSDIVLTSLNDEEKELILKCTDHALLFGSRMNVDSLEEPHHGLMYHQGFDFFFFDEHYLHLFPRSNYCIGLPWWDYWAVIVPVLKGLPIHRMLTPIALHKKHEVKWDANIWKSLGDELSQFLKPVLKFTDLKNLASVLVSYIEEKSNVQFVRRNRPNANVAVVYDGKDSTRDSPSVRALRHQTMQGIHVLNSNARSLASELQAFDYVYFMEEGDVIPPYFFELMCSEIGDKAFIQCGFRILRDAGFDCTLRLPANLKSSPDEKRIARKTVVFAKEALLRNPNVMDDWTGEDGRFLGIGLIQQSFEQYVLERLRFHSGVKLYLYGTGSHSKILLDLFKTNGIKIEGVFSPDIQLHDTKFEGVPVIHDRFMKMLEFDRLLISSYTFEKVIYERVAQVIPEHKIMRLYYL